MNIDHLKTFVTVAKIGNFTKAARKLFLTQPAVSQHIMALEHFYNTTLFDRTGKKIILTRQGEILLKETAELLAKFRKIETLFEEINDLSRGKLDIAASAVIGTYMLPEIIGHFNAAYPSIEIDLRIGNTHQVESLVLEGNIDFGFAAGPTKQYPELEKILIHTEKIISVVSPKSKLAAKSVVTIEDLQHIPFIGREKGTQTRQYITHWFSEQRCSKEEMVPKFIELENVETAKRFVEEGFGITVIPETAVRREIEDGHLTKVNLKGFNEEASFYLLFHKGRRFSVAAETFLAELPSVFPFANTLDVLNYLDF